MNTLNTTRRRGWHCEVTVKVRKDARGSCLPKFDLHNILLEKETNSALRTTEGHRHDIEAGEETSICCSLTSLPFLTWLAKTTFWITHGDIFFN